MYSGSLVIKYLAAHESYMSQSKPETTLLSLNKLDLIFRLRIFIIIMYVLAY